MLEGLVAGQLNKYLGQFVEGINKEQLKVSVFAGNVQLEGLKIKRDALRFLRLPIAVKSGFVRRIVLKANWAKLSSVPVQVELDGVYLVAEPDPNFEPNKEDEEKHAISTKRATLEEAQEVVLAQQLAQDEKDASSHTRADALTDKIIDNLQVSIKNIHVRYEEELPVKGQDSPVLVAAGVCLRNVSFDTTDENWQKVFVIGAQRVFKLVQLNEFFFYFQQHTKSLQAEQLGQVFDKETKSLQCILQPLSGTVKVVMERERRSSPGLQVQVDLHTLGLTLEEKQYSLLLDLVSSFSRGQESLAIAQSKVAPSFRKFKGRAERVQYAELYKRTLNATWLPELTEDDAKTMERIEDEVDVTPLLEAREWAFAQVKRQLKGGAVTLRVKEKKGFFSGWFSSSSKTKKSPMPDLSEEEKEQLFRELDFDPESVKRVLTEDFVLLDLKCTLRDMYATLLVGADPILNVTASQVKTDVVSRPTSTSVRASLGTTTWRDHFTGSESYPNILTPATEEKSSVPLLSAAVDINPLDNPEIDTRIRVDLQPTELVLSKTRTDRLVQFVSPSEDADLRVLEDWAERAMAELQIMAFVNLKKRMTQRSAIDIGMDLAAPTIVIPEDITSQSPRSAALIADFGRLTLDSTPQKKAIVEKLVDRLSGQEFVETPPIDEATANQCFDRYDVKAKQVQLFLQNGVFKLGQDSSARRWILRPCNLGVVVHTSIAPSMLWLPSLKADASLEIFDVDISAKKFHDSLRILNKAVLGDTASAATDQLADKLASSNAVDATKTKRSVQKHVQDELAKIERSFTSDYDKELKKQLTLLMSQDKDNSGTLTLEELTPALGLENAEVLMKEADKDEDGAITVEELKAWWTTNQQRRKRDLQLVVGVSINTIRLTIQSDRDEAEDLTKPRRKKRKDQVAVELRAQSLRLGMAKRGFDMGVDFHVGGLSVKDTVHGNEATKQILRTIVVDDAVLEEQRQGLLMPAEVRDQTSQILQKLAQDKGAGAQFVNVSYYALNRVSPDFERLRVDSDIIVAIGGLVVTVEPTVVQRNVSFLLSSFLPAITKMSADASAGDAAGAKKALPAPKVEEKSSAPSDAVATGGGQQPNYTNMQVNASFADLTVLFYQRKQKLAAVSIKKLEADYKAFDTNSHTDIESVVGVSLDSVAFAIQPDDAGQDASPKGRKDKVAIELRAQKLRLAFVKRQFDMAVNFHLGALAVEDSLISHSATKMMLQTVVVKEDVLAQQRQRSLMPSTVRQQTTDTLKTMAHEADAKDNSSQFVHVSYYALNRESPDFENVRVESDIAVAIGGLIVTLEPTVLYRNISYLLLSFLPAISQMANVTEALPDADAADSQSQKEELEEKEEQSAVVARTQYTSMQLNASFAALSVRLYKRKQKLSTISVEKLTADYKAYTHSLHADVNLRTIAIKDHTKGSDQYPHIIRTQPPAKAAKEASFVTLSYDTYNEAESDFPGHASSLKARLRGFRAVFLNRFVKEIVAYATQGDIARLTEAVSSGNKDTSSNVKAIANTPSSDKPKQFNKATDFMKMDVKLTDLQLIVPMHSLSDRGLIAVVEAVTVSNQVVTVEKQQVPRMQAELSAFTVATLFGDKAAPIPFFALGPVRVRIDQVSGDSPLTAVDADLGCVNMCLSHPQYHMLMNTVSGNLAEDPSVQPIRQDTSFDALHRVHGQSISASQDEKTSETSSRMQVSVRMGVLRLELLEPHDHLPTASSAVSDLTEEKHSQTHQQQAEKIAKLMPDITQFTQPVQQSPSKGTDDAVDADALPTLKSILAIYPDDVTEKPMLLLEIKRVDASYTQGKEGMSVDARMLALTITDITETPPNCKELKFRRLLTVPPSAATKNGVVVKVKQQADGDMFVDVELAHARFVLAAALFRLPQFFSVMTQPSALETAAPSGTSALSPVSSASRSAKPGSVHPDTRASQDKPQSSGAMHVKLKVDSPSLHLIQDPTADKSIAVVLSWDLLADVHMQPNGELQVALDMANVKIFHALFDAKSYNNTKSLDMAGAQLKSRLLLDPFALRLQLLQYKSAILHDETAMSLAVDVDPLKAWFTYRDYKVLMSAVRSLSFYTDAAEVVEKKTDELVEQQPPETKEEHGFGESRVLLRLRGVAVTLLNDALNHDIPLARFALQGPLPKQRASEVHFAPNFRETDDTTDLAPKMTLSDALLLRDDVVGSASLRMHALGCKRDVILDAVVSADYFNFNNVFWEPMLEPWNVRIQLTQNAFCGVEGSDVATWAKVTGKNNLNVNVTHDMLEAVTDSIQLLTLSEDSDMADFKDDSDKGLCPFRVVNSTQYVLRVALVGAKGANELEVPPSSSKALSALTSFQEAESSSVFVSLLDGNSVALKASRPVSFATIAANVQALADTNGAETGVRASFDVSNKDGFRVLHVHSPFAVLNHTPRDLEVQVVGLPKPLPVAPGDTMWLPLKGTAGKNSPMAIRPSSSEYSYGQAGQVPYAGGRASAGWFHVECAPGNHSGLPLHLAEQVEETEAGVVKFHFFPPVAVRNLLTSDVNISLYDKGAKEGPQLAIAQGQVAQLDHLSTQGALLLSLNVPSLKHGATSWSEPKRLPSHESHRRTLGSLFKDADKKGPITAVTDLVVKDSQGRELRLNVECAFKGPAPATAVFTIYAPYWIYDMTGLTAMVSADRKRLMPEHSCSLPSVAEVTELQKQELASSRAKRASLYKFSAPEIKDAANQPEDADEDQDDVLHRDFTYLSDRNKTCFASMFSFSERLGRKATKARIRLGNSAWSKKFGLDALGTDTALSIFQSETRRQSFLMRKASSVLGGSDDDDEEISVYDTAGAGDADTQNAKGNGVYELGVSIRAGDGPYRRTTMVSLFHRYIIVNTSDQDIAVRQCNTNAELRVPTGESVPFHWPDCEAERLMTFKFLDPSWSHWEWTGKFAINQVSDTAIRLRSSKAVPYSQFAKVEIRVKGPTIFVLLGQYEREFIPYRIENRTVNYPIKIRQKDVQSDWTIVNPYSARPYAWDEPTMSNKLDVVVTKSDFNATYDIDKVQDLGKEKLGDGTELFVYVKSQGVTKVLVVSAFPNPSEDLSLTRSFLEQENRALIKKLQQLKNDAADTQLLLARRDSVSQTVGQAKRPKDVPATKSELRVEVLSARNVGHKYIYIESEFNGKKDKTQTSRASSQPHWDVMFRYDATSASSRSQLIIRVFKKTTFGGMFGDDSLGEIHIRLSPELDAHEPVQQWYRLKATSRTKGVVKGEVFLRLWWVPQGSAVFSKNINMLRADLKEKRRVAALLEKKITTNADILDQNQGTHQDVQLLLDSDKSEVIVEVCGVRGVRNAVSKVAGGMDGRVVCAVSMGGEEAPLSTLLGTTGKEYCQRGAGAVVLYDHDEPCLQDYNAKFRFLLPKYYFADAGANSPPPPKVVTLFVYLEQLPKVRQPYEQGDEKDEPMAPVKVVPIGSLAVPINQLATTKREPATLDEEKAKKDVEKANKKWFPLRLPSAKASDAPELHVSAVRHDARPYDEQPLSTLDFSAPRFGVSIVDTTPEEMLYFSLMNVSLELEDSPSLLTTQLVVEHLQLDNQMSGFSFPIVLAPSPVDEEQRQAFLQLSFTKAKTVELDSVFRDIYLVEEDPSTMLRKGAEDDEKEPSVMDSVAAPVQSNVHMFQYFSLLVQALDLSIEEPLIWRLMAFVNDFMSSSLFAGKAKKRARNVESSPNLARQASVEELSRSPALSKPLDIDDMADQIDLLSRQLTQVYDPPASSTTKLFFKVLQIQPISVTVTFQANLRIRSKHQSGSMSFNPFQFVLSLAGATFGNIDRAPLRLNGVTITDCAGTAEMLSESLLQHYKMQALRQAYLIIGSVEFLGNPVGLVNNLGSGVMDFFYEPAKGLVKSPKAFGKGLAKGSVSLVTNTFSGVFGAASKVADSFGKGAAALTMDEKFVEKQQSNLREDKNAVTGFFSGAKSLGTGVISGITGIVTQPAKGLKEDGAKGFFQGIGKGLVGVIAKPTAGAFDLATQTLKGIGNTPSLLLGKKGRLTRVRPPRFIAPNDRHVWPFVEAEALGQRVFAQVKPEDEFKANEIEFFVLAATCGRAHTLWVSNLRWILQQIDSTRSDNIDSDTIVFQVRDSAVQSVTAENDHLLLIVSKGKTNVLRYKIECTTKAEASSISQQLGRYIRHRDARGAH